MIELNKIYNENCLDTMVKMPDNFIDLVVTSPPYDNMRLYEGYSFDFKSIAKELYRVIKIGGVLVWIVNDQTKSGNESGTSFKQALYLKEIGFNLGDTMIWQKTCAGSLGSNNFYLQNFEYMFILTKGKIKTHNLISDRKNKVAPGTKVSTNGGITSKKEQKYRTITRKEFGKRTNIWTYTTQKRSKHPAPFPELLVKDHIISWSNENDTIYDPFMGSGTTAKIARSLKRNYIGSEISKEYCELSEKRLQNI